MAEADELGLVWGARDIARVLGVSERQTYGMLEAGQLPAARKLAGKWVISRKKLIEMFEGEPA